MEAGVISLIYVENFVTYTKARIIPGRYLNVIIGPNGTGKSTIVCAIVIGLGGKLSIIGRATEVGDYVKTGCEQAKIEITLQLKDGQVVICRQFDRQSSSSWRIDGKPTTQKSVEEMTKKFNIQMDNLCQFLPQEKVQEFSNLSSVNLLIETLRSVGDPKLLQTLARLKELRNKHREVEKIISDKNVYLKQQTDKYEGLKDMVGNIKEKKRIKKNLEALTQKKAWILYDEKRKDLLKAKKERDECEKQVKKLQDKLKPIDEKIKQIQANVDRIRHLDSIQMKEIVEKGTKVGKLVNRINGLDEEVMEIEESWRQRLEIESRRDQEIQMTQQQIEKFKSDLQNLINEFGTIADMDEKQRTILYDIDVKRREVTNLKEQINMLRQQDDNATREMNNCNMQMQRVQNIKAKRLEILKNMNEDAYEGVLWLQKNKDKFNHTIHEPILLHINVHNKQHAKYLESMIPPRDLFAFVCEDKGDMNNLIHYLRNERKLIVNVLHSDPNREVNLNPRIPIDQLKQFGFQNYLSSLFDAPPTIMNYLVSMHHLNNIPFGSNKVDEFTDSIPSDIHCFFSGNSRYNVSSSKYSGAKSTSISSISGNDSLSVGIDTSLMAEISSRINHFQQQKAAIIENIKSSNEQLDIVNKELETLRESRAQFQNNITQVNTLESKIKRTEVKLKDLETEKMSTEDINKMFKTNIQTNLRNCIKIYREINVVMEECYKCSAVNEAGRLSLKVQQRKLANIKHDSDDLRAECEMSKKLLRQHDVDLQPLKAAAERRLREAKELSGGLTPNDDGFKAFETVFNKLPPSVQEIEIAISEAKAKLYCMGKDSDGEMVLETYEKTKTSIEHTKALLQEKTEEQNKLVEKMTTKRSEWYPKVEELVQQINMNFSRFFSELKCSGELSLTQDINMFDFDKYGLKIMVKFRDADSLQELTRTHQSGGERALTTAVYMIALQNLSRVPFRCVDEINQGMDPINERRVFQLLVQITGNSKGSQYFFLTPKLLPGLEYPESVTVHCVYNGPYVIPHTQFNISDYVKNIKAILGQ